MIAGDFGTDTCELAKWADHDTFVSTKSGSLSLAKAVVALSNQGICIWSSSMSADAGVTWSSVIVGAALAGSETGGTFVCDSGNALIDFGCGCGPFSVLFEGT